MPKPAIKYPWCDPACPSWPHAIVGRQLLAERPPCGTCGRPTRAVFDSVETWESKREAWYKRRPQDRIASDDLDICEGCGLVKPPWDMVMHQKASKHEGIL